jgi:CheY-like chemotaxis protein
MHPNRRFDIYLTDRQLSILNGFEVCQIIEDDQSYSLLLKLGSACVVVLRSGNLGSKVLVRWANGQGYTMLGIKPEEQMPPPPSEG